MSQRDRNRSAFPETARFVDEMREVFGTDVALEFAEENGRTLGQRDLLGTAVSASRMVLRVPEGPAPGKKGRK